MTVTARGPLSRFTEGLPRPFWFLWAGLLVNRTGSFIVPMMTVYLTRERGLTLVQAGTIVAMYGAGSFVGTTLGGWLADHLGRRATLLVSLVSSSALMVATGQARDERALTALVFALGLCADLFRPASQALVADLVSPEHRVKAFGTQYWAINLGFSFAAVVGGFVARQGFSVLFLADAATTLACAALVFVGVPETKPQAPPTRLPGSVLTPFLDARFAPFLAVNLVMAFVFLQHLTALPKDMADKGLGPEAFGLVLATNGVLIVLLQPLVLGHATRAPRGRSLAFAALLTGLGFGATALAESTLAFALTVAVWTVGEIVMAPVNSAVVAERAPVHLRGRYQAAFGLTWSVAFMAAPVAGPRVIERTGLPGFWATCLVLGLGAALAFLALERPATSSP
ncbi:MAG: MFS transporter [Myxococcaceae bacterium]|nr:MFS transporter [Myxococcaceae bacterium]